MADSKITALTSISTSTDPANDPLVIVDVSDTSMAASGTTKKVTLNQLLGASGTATLASATITGDLTVDTSTLKVDSTNNRVGIQITSPTAPLEVGETSGTALRLRRLTSGNTIDLNFYNTNTTVGDVAGIRCDGDGLANTFGAISFWTTQTPNSLVERYRISSVGVHTWQNVGGVAGTAMTLNSTGLGVGGVPSNVLTVRAAQDTGLELNSAASNSSRLITAYDPANSRWYINSTFNGSGTTLPIAFLVGNTERMRIDTSGNVGIGVTPSAWSATFRSLDIGSGALTSQPSQQSIGLYANAFENGTNYTRKALGFAAGYSIYNGAHYWLNAASGAAGSTFAFGSAVMTLDASGALLIGQTTAGLDAQGGFWFREASSAFGSSIIINHRTAVGTGNSYSEFTYNGGVIGSISQNGTTGVLYNTTSDYRLKEQVQPLVGCLDRVKALKPSVYKWKADGSSGEGFLAHELAEVVPAAVTGEKDAVNEDGSIKPQGVDMSRVVPVLVAAIQELAARVETLETR